MATKNTNKPENDMNKYLNERVPFRAFKDDGEYKDDLVVIVNGKTFQIQRGKTVQIPRYVLYAIKNAERQKAYAASISHALATQSKFN